MSLDNIGHFPLEMFHPVYPLKKMSAEYINNKLSRISYIHIRNEVKQIDSIKRQANRESRFPPSQSRPNVCPSVSSRFLCFTTSFSPRLTIRSITGQLCLFVIESFADSGRSIKSLQSTDAIALRRRARQLSGHRVVSFIVEATDAVRTGQSATQLSLRCACRSFGFVLQPANPVAFR